MALRPSWRMVRRIALSFVAFLVVAGVVSWYWPNAGYDVERVHPRIRALREPFQYVRAAYYLDGGSIGVTMVDAEGQVLDLVFPNRDRAPNPDAPRMKHSRMWLGSINDDRKPQELEFTQDSMNRVLEIVDDYGVGPSFNGVESAHALMSCRYYPRDFARYMWLRYKGHAD